MCCKYDALTKEKVSVGDVIYIEANSGAVKRVGRSDAYASEFDLEDSYLIQRSDGSYAEGWICEFDKRCNMYKVLIIGAGHKWVVREQIEQNTVHF